MKVRSFVATVHTRKVIAHMNKDMTSVHLYRVYCTSGDGYQETWESIEPTACPLNSGHSIDASQTVIKETIGGSNLSTNDDNRLVVAPSLMPDTFTGQFMGRGDDVANGIRGSGPPLYVSMPDGSAETQTTIAQAVDLTLALGCDIQVYGANKDDYVTITLMAPASPVTANGTSTGNCNLVSVGASGNIIIPSATSTGAYDVNLTEPINANLAGPNPLFVSKVTPIPAEDISGNVTKFNGFWDYDESTGAITPSATQTGRYNLYDFAVPLTRWVNKWPVWTVPGGIYTKELFIHNKGAKILPHWYLSLETTRASTHAVSDPAVEYQFTFYVARKRTV